MNAVDKEFDSQDIVIMSAAVADYRPKTVADEKIKKNDGEMAIELERTDDILGTMSKRKKNQFLCGFSIGKQSICLKILRTSLKRKILI